MRRILVSVFLVLSLACFVCPDAMANDRVIDQSAANDSQLEWWTFVDAGRRVGFSFTVDFPSKLTDIQFTLAHRATPNAPPVEIRLYEIVNGSLLEMPGTLRVEDQIPNWTSPTPELNVLLDYSADNIVLSPDKTYAVGALHTGTVNNDTSWIGLSMNRGNPYLGGGRFSTQVGSDEVQLSDDQDIRFILRAEAIADQNGLLSFQGTPDNDIVSFDPVTRELTINDETCIIPADVDEVDFYGEAGVDLVTCLDQPGESDFAVLKGQDLKLQSSTITFRAFESEFLEFVGSDSTDVSIIFDTDGDDSFTSSKLASSLLSDASSLVARSVGDVYMFSQGGDDTASYRGTSDNEVVQCNLGLKRVRAYSGDSFVLMDGFEDFFTNTGKGVEDEVAVVDSNESDYLYTDGGFTHAFNSIYSYRFIGYETLNVWSNGSGNDRALMQLTIDSVYEEGPTWHRMTSPNFQVGIFGFDSVTVVDP